MTFGTYELAPDRTEMNIGVYRYSFEDCEFHPNRFTWEVAPVSDDDGGGVTSLGV